MKCTLQRIAIICCMSMIIFGCAGTINTVKNKPLIANNYKKAYIISTDNSQYIQFKFGIITPFAYIVPSDNPSVQHDVIGTTAEVIKQELQKQGIEAIIGSKDDTPEGFDFIVQYYDTWRWDFKKILDRLEIVFISPDGNEIIARSTFNIYSNKEMHNFPTPEKEVPKMIKELLSN